MKYCFECPVIYFGAQSLQLINEARKLKAAYEQVEGATVTGNERGRA